MGKVHLALPTVGQPLIFTEALLNQFPQKLQQNLKAIGALESFVADSWICTSCDNEHDYHLIGSKRLKACENDSSAQFTPVSDDEAIRWQINWERLLRQIQTENQLSLFSFPQFIPEMLTVGRGCAGRLLVVLTRFGSITTFRQQFTLLADLYPDPEMLLICVDSPLLDSATMIVLHEKKCRIMSLESLMANFWKLDLVEAKEQNRLQLNRSSQTLTIDGVTIALSRVEFQTALIIARANGNPVSQSHFSDEYYNLNSTQLLSTSDELPNLKDIVYHINSKIRSLNKNVTGQVFKAMGGKRGYRVISEFCPVKVL
jgi:hypothetical protein